MGCSGANLRNGARSWYRKIREAERQRKGSKNSYISIESRRLRYHVALAVRMALQESNLISLNNKIQDKSASSSSAVMGYTRGDDRVIVPSLPDLFVSLRPLISCKTSADWQDRAHALSQVHIGYLQDLGYLVRCQRNLTSLLGTAISSMDATLCVLSQIVNHLRHLVSLPHEQRLKFARTKGPGKGWKEEDFRVFTKIRNWDDVLRIGHNLYQAQQCVSLWPTRRSAYSTAVALALWSCAALVNEVPQQLAHWQDELSAVFGHQRFYAAFRFVEMKLLLCAWSTSIPDAGLALPAIKPPVKRRTVGLIGNGHGGWNGDKRRPIPPTSIAAAAAKTIAESWRLILRTRCRTRHAAMPIDEEIYLARTMFGSATANATARSRRDSSLASSCSKAGTPYPTAAPSPAYSNGAAASRAGSSSSSRSALSPPPYSAHPSRPAFHSGPPRGLVAPEDDVERLIARGDDTSDEDDNFSSDDEMIAFNARPVRNSGLGLNIGELPRPFGFSVGLDDFRVEKTDYQTPPAMTLQRDSSSEASPYLMHRERSVDSSRSEGGMSSATETEYLTRLHPSSMASSQQIPSAMARARALKLRDERVSPSPSSAGSSRSASPLVALSSTPSPSLMSVPLSSSEDELSFRVLNGRNDPDNDHVGMLIREREQYVVYRASAERAAGRMISQDVEKALDAWIKHQQTIGSLPVHFTRHYLSTIGINGDPLEIDLAPFVGRHSDHWSPLESLLRAGIKPPQLPGHLIPHSVAAVRLALYMPSHCDILNPANTSLSAEDMARDIEVLFTGTETFDDILLSAEESQQRLKAYQMEDWWDDLPNYTEMGPSWRQKQKTGHERAEAGGDRARRTGQGLPGNMLEGIAKGYSDFGYDLMQFDKEEDENEKRDDRVGQNENENGNENDGEGDVIRDAALVTLCSTSEAGPSHLSIRSTATTDLWNDDGFNQLGLFGDAEEATEDEEAVVVPQSSAGGGKRKRAGGQHDNGPSREVGSKKRVKKMPATPRVTPSSPAPPYQPVDPRRVAPIPPIDNYGLPPTVGTRRPP